MITQTVTVTEKNAPNIIIGRRGTYNTEEIVFDLTYLVETFGSGSAVMMVKRPMDNTAYPAVTEQDGNTLTWTVSDIDTNFKGHGECELFWYVDDGLAKSLIWPLTILRDIGTTTEEPPEPYQTWVDDLTELGAETLQNAQSAAQSATSAGNAQTAAETAQGLAEDAQEAAEAAQAFLENASATATTLEPGSSATASYEDGVFTFGIPKGDPGDPATNLVTSVNGETGAVVLDATDVGAYALPSGGIPKTDLASSVQTSLGKADTALQTAPVTSVNTQIGDVVLDAGDIGYESTTVEDELGTINSALSSLESVTEIIDTASGAIASFPDGAGLPMRSLLATIEPQQDLHGYDAPWAGGGGKNLLQTTGTNQTRNGVTYTVNSDGTVLVNGTSTKTDPYTVGTVDLVGGTAYVLSSGATNDSTFYLQAIGDGISSINTISGAKTFTPPADMTATIRIAVSSGKAVSNVTIKPMICLSTATDPTVFAPYSNICPISGWTGLQGQRTGANVLDDSDMEVLPNNLMIARNEGRGGEPFLLKGGCTYTLSCNSSATVDAIYFIKPYGSANDPLAYQFGGKSLTYTPTKDTMAGCVFYWANGRPEDATHIMLNVGSTAYAYEEYQSEPISVSFGTTVYGGSDEVVGGNGTSTHAIVTLDGTQSLSNNGILAYGGAQIIYTPTPAKAYAVQQEIEDLLSNIFHTNGSYDDPFYFNGRKTNGNIYFNMPAGVTTVQEAKDWFANNPTQVWYKLATPTTFTHTPQEVDTLYGQNNVFVDTGDVTVTYQANLKGYIDKVLGS